PLVDRDVAEPAIAAWLDRLAADPDLPDLMLMPLVAQSGPFASILADLLAWRGCEATSFDPPEPALLLPGSKRADYSQGMSRSRRRNLRRRERKLEQLGGISTEIAKDGDALPRALADFFRLEAIGWKGRAGTAAAQNDDAHRFLDCAVTAL